MPENRRNQPPGPPGDQASGKPRDEASRHAGFPHYHTFVSHTGAAKQKETVAYPIRNRLLEQHPKMSVFVDEESLRVGDDAVAHMRAALDTCDTAVVVLSPEYIRKRWPMWELHILVRRLLKGEAGLLVALYNCESSACLKELASKEAPCYTKEFWGSSDSGEDDAVKAPGPQEMAMLQQWALDPASVQGCSLIHPDEWATVDELAAQVEAGVADLLHACGQLPPRLVIFNTIPLPLWPDLEVRQGEARQAEAALLEQRYVELRGGPGEGKSMLAQYLTERLCARWQRSPPEGTVGQTCLAVEVDLRGLEDGASLKEVVASQVLAAASVVGLQPAHHIAAASPLDGQQPSPQDSRERRWLDLMSWVLSLAPRPLLLLLENAEDAAQHGELPDVVARLRAASHVHLIVATRALTSLSQQAPAQSCVVDLGVLDTEAGLRVAELHLGRELREGAEREAARKLVEAVQANPLFCGVAACLVKQTGRTWEELLHLCAQDMAQVRPADGRAGGMGRRLVLLQRWLRSALEPHEQLFLARIAVFAGSFTQAGAAAMQLPIAAATAAGQQAQMARGLVEESLNSITDAGPAVKRPRSASAADQEEEERPRSASAADQKEEEERPQSASAADQKEEEEQQQQQQQQQQNPSTAQLPGGEPEGQASGRHPGTEDILQRLQLLSLIRQLVTDNQPGSYHMGSRWMMHALVQQAALKLLQDGGDPGHRQQTAAEQPTTTNDKPLQPGMNLAVKQLYCRFATWMLWHPEGPGQALVRCDPTVTSQPDAQLLWYLLGVEQANLQAAGAKLPLTDLQAECWQGDSGIERAFEVDKVGAVLTSTGQYKVALQLRRCMVEVLSMNHGASNMHTHTLQSNLAATFLDVGQLHQARQLMDEVIAAMTVLLGPEHPDTLTVKSNLACTLQQMGQLGEAQQLQEMVLAARTQLLGPEHPDTLSTKSNLGITLRQMGRLGEARQLMEEVQAAMTQLLGPEHPHTLTTQGNLASMLEEMGQLAEARQLQELVLAARTQLLGPDHPDTLSITSNLANTLGQLGHLGEARKLKEQVLAAQTQLLGPEHPDTLDTKGNLANTLLDMGQLTAARELQEQVLAAMTQLLGAEHPDTLSVASNLAITLHKMGQLEEACKLQREVLAARVQRLGAEHPHALVVKNNLASTLQEMGQLAEACVLQEQVLAATIQLLGAGHPDSLGVKSNLANTLHKMGQLAQARELQGAVLAARVQLLGAEHPDTLAVKNNLASTLQAIGQLEEARQLTEEVLAAMTQLLGPDHPDTLSVKGNLASILQEMGQLEQARQLMAEVSAAMTKLLGPEHPDTLGVNSNLASTLYQMGQLGQARQLMEEVQAAMIKVLGPEHADTLSVRSDLASILQEMGQMEQARQLMEDVLAAMTKLLGPEHPDTLTVKSNLATTLVEMGQLVEARQLQEEILAAMTVLRGAEHPDTYEVKSNLASTLQEMGQLAQARQLQEELLAAMTQLRGPEHPDTYEVKSNLASTLQEMGQLAQARQLMEEVLTAVTQLVGPDHPDTLSVKTNLAHTLQEMGQTEEARQLLEEVLAAMTQLVDQSTQAPSA